MIVVLSLGEKIRNAREDIDLLQSDMARLIPMNQSNYSKIERGVQEPSIAQLRRICQILKLDPRYLLDLDNFEMLTANDLKLLSDVKDFIKNHQN
ncbi:MAG: helix-turn-helix transcriptional regulator [Clostridia bacterium]|nr:helix-turn-helix transcriptional regulator [Clostridia bacterium]